MFRFPLSKTRAGAGADVLTITSRDCIALLTLVSVSGLDSVPPEELHVLIATHAEEGVLSKAGFDRAVRALVPNGATMGPMTRRFLSTTLSCMFYAFDRAGAGAVDAREFSTGLSLLCAGSKSGALLRRRLVPRRRLLLLWQLLLLLLSAACSLTL